MLKISKDGEVFINGQTINEFVNSNSTSVKRTVIINNGKVVKDDFQNIEGFENFQNKKEKECLNEIG